jgi:ribosome maturation protein Sdo1
MLASQKDLQEYFNTTDPKEVCREILEKGELQVSEQERQALHDRLALNELPSTF